MPTLYAGGALGPGYGTVPNKTLLSFSLSRSLARSLSLSRIKVLKRQGPHGHGTARPGVDCDCQVVLSIAGLKSC
jgi:hypothetical protein